MLLVEKIFKQDFHLVEEFLNKNFSSPTHWPHWNEVVSRHFGTSFLYYGALLNDEIRGILPVHRVRDGLKIDEFSGQFHYIPYGGWIFDRSNHFDNFKLKIGSFSSLTIFSLPLVPEFNYSNIESSEHQNTLILDLQKDIDEIWHLEVDSKRRNMIRKAEKNNVQVRVSVCSGIDSFYPTYVSSSQKNDLNILTKDFFSDLFSTNQNVKFAVLNSVFEDNLLSNIIVAFDKDYAIYWLGNNTKSLNLGQSELLQWHAIRIMKEHGCKYYDLCFIEKDKLPNIYEFKKGFAKTIITVPLSSHSPYSRKVLNRVSKLLY